MKSDRTLGFARNPAQDDSGREARLQRRVGELLGVGKVRGRSVKSHLEIHLAMVNGAFSHAALIRFIAHFKTLEVADATKVLGVSRRTLARMHGTPSKPLPTYLASKLWCFAETFIQATEVFGGQEQAEHWLSRPTMGLNGQRPIEMLLTIQGAELVNDFLVRLEYGVHG